MAFGVIFGPLQSQGSPNAMDQLCVSVSLNVQLAYHGNENILKKRPSNETNATDDAFFYLKMAFGSIFQPH